MKMSVLLLDFFRELWKTRTRFFSILLIVALGCGFFVGVQATGIDMKETIDNYFKELDYMDAEIISNYGLTEKDINAIADVDMVEQVSPSYQADVLLDSAQGDGNIVIRVHSYNHGENINQFTLIEGRLPETQGECLVEAVGASSMDGEQQIKIGDTLTVKTGREEDTLKDILYRDAFTVVGTVESPLYFATQKGNSLIGSGTVGSYMFLPAEEFSMEVFTTAYISMTKQQEETFSEDYKVLQEKLADTLDSLAVVREPLRIDEIKEEGQGKIDDAAKELEDGKTEAQEKIDDAKVQIGDARIEIAKAEVDLIDGEQKYIDGQIELDEEITKAEKELTEAYQELLENEEKLKDGEKEFAEGKEEFDQNIPEVKEKLYESQAQLLEGGRLLRAGQEELAESRRQLNDAKRQLDAGKVELEQSREFLASKEEELIAGEELLQQAKQGNALLENVVTNGALFSPAQTQQAIEIASKINADLGAAVEAHLLAVQAGTPSPTEDIILDTVQQMSDEITEQEPVLLAGRAEIEGGKQQLIQAEATLDQSVQAYLAGEEQYKGGKEEIADGRKASDQGAEQIEEAWEQVFEAEDKLKDAKIELVDGKEKLADGWGEYNDGLAEFEEAKIEGQQKLTDAKIEIEDGKIKLADAKIELAEAEIELKDGEKELIETVEENQEKIDDAQKEIDDLAEAEWMITTRLDRMDVAEYEENANRIDSIAAIFPVFFLAIAALVCLTTMTRMVEDQRVQVGTLKSMGYGNGSIIAKFVGYATLASVVGSVFGMLLGFKVFPEIIFTAYRSSMYRLPDIQAPFRWDLAVITATVAVLCTALSSYLVCSKMLKETPASLLRPVAPKPGKRILLERISPIWKRMSFSNKVTARNLFRYKRRMLMSVMGIAGCTALLLAGFGMRDSVGNLVPLQFQEIAHYDMTIILDDEKLDKKELQQLEENHLEITNSYFLSIQNGEISLENSRTKQDALIITVDNPEEFAKYTTLRNPEDKMLISLDDKGAVISQKLAQLFQLKVGDTIPFKMDTLTGEAIVSGITENYTFHYIYLTDTYYQQVVGEPAKINRQLVQLDTTNGELSEIEKKIAEDIMNVEQVMTISLTSTILGVTEDLIKSLNTVVIVLIASAGLLAFVVMYNLTNINIAERFREIATLKVLGFYDKETTKYISSENMILSIIGALFGLLGGMLLTNFVLNAAEVDMMHFPRGIHPLSYLYAFGLTILFTVIVRVIAHIQLKKINMIESLKSVE